MKLQPDRLEGVNAIQAYAPGSITVNGIVRRTGLIIPWQGEILPWQDGPVTALTEADFERVAALGPELVIFGSGARLQFVRPSVLRPLIERRIGIETMDSQAAARTYNILVGEGRRAVAALLPALARPASTHPG